MADNVSITAGSGTVVATDQIAGGAHVQYMKLMSGTADDTTVLPISAAYGIPVDITRSISLIAIGNIASGATDSGAPVKIGGVYNSSLPTFTAGQRGDLQITANGFLRVELASSIAGEDLTALVLGTVHKPLASSTYAYSTDNQMTQVTKRTSKGSAGNVFSVIVTNTNAAVRYFQLHNKATAPAGTEVPVLSIPIPISAGSSIQPLIINEDYFGEGGHYLSTGVSWAISTTYATFTDSATASEHVVALKYI